MGGRQTDSITDQLVPSDSALDAALAASAANGLPAINVAPNQGKLLQVLARSINATRILEVGTLGGYSIFLARALAPGGEAGYARVRTEAGQPISCRAREHRARGALAPR